MTCRRICPIEGCGGKTEVYDVRGWMRRRECQKCGLRFRTREVIVSQKKTTTYCKQAKRSA